MTSTVVFYLADGTIFGVTKCPPEVASRQTNPAATGAYILPTDFPHDPLACRMVDGVPILKETE